MQHRLSRFHALTHMWHHIGVVEIFALFLAAFVLVVPAEASTRFQERGLYMQSAVPAEVTSYTLAMRYMTPAAVGSVNLLFCIDPIPYHPCVTPPGLDVSNATLTDQSGETGYTIATQSTNHIVLSRAPSMIMSGAPSSYTFSGITNPTDTEQAFSIRLRSHASTDATGPQIDFGSVRGQVTESITLQTQVPPMLVFCLAEEVELYCADTNDNYYTDMGDLSPDSTLIARSQMAVGTNATAGFAITVNGSPPTAGTSVIDTPAVPTESRRGTNQFGINLVANTDPGVGNDPEGPFANAVASPSYSVPNQYKYISGDEVAYSPNVSLMRKFTVSYILNSSPSLRAGVYSTTLTFIASGRF